MTKVLKHTGADRTAPIFVSHGAPDLVMAETDAHRFLEGLGNGLRKPTAILTVSAHFETAAPTLVSDPQPEMIYDFGGFDPALRTLTYKAPGSPEVAERAAYLLAQAGYAPDILAKRGYDHGVWVPLLLAYPDADIPVAQLSIVPNQSPEWHYRLGEALAPLCDEGVLIFASGSLTHNLSEVFGSDGLRPRSDAVPDWVSEFADWISIQLKDRDDTALLSYRDRAPHAVRNHPTDEHLLPLFVALGAAGRAVPGHLLHSSREFGVLAMDAYRFDESPLA